MNLNDVKATLEAIGYPVKGPDWDDVLADLHCSYGAQKIGSSINNLGDAKPLYVSSGNIAFMVDNQDDLHRACIQIKNVLDARKPAITPVMKRDTRSRYLPEIISALEGEIDISFKIKRPLGIIDTEYEVLFNVDTRSQTRKSAQIMDDLLSDDKSRNAKAVEALKALLILQ